MEQKWREPEDFGVRSRGSRKKVKKRHDDPFFSKRENFRPIGLRTQPKGGGKILEFDEDFRKIVMVCLGF